jgi:hypothetical protein
MSTTCSGATYFLRYRRKYELCIIREGESILYSTSMVATDFLFPTGQALNCSPFCIRKIVRKPCPPLSSTRPPLPPLPGMALIRVTHNFLCNFHCSFCIRKIFRKPCPPPPAPDPPPPSALLALIRVTRNFYAIFMFCIFVYQEVL